MPHPVNSSSKTTFEFAHLCLGPLIAILSKLPISHMDDDACFQVGFSTSRSLALDFSTRTHKSDVPKMPSSYAVHQLKTLHLGFLWCLPWNLTSPPQSERPTWTHPSHSSLTLLFIAIIFAIIFWSLWFLCLTKSALLWRTEWWCQTDRRSFARRVLGN